jgi:hypothetical protein
MEIAYSLFAADAIIGIGLLLLYLRQRREPAPRANEARLLAELEAMRRAALAAAEEAAQARAELERVLQRAERVTRLWCEAAPGETDRSADARLKSSLQSLRRS